MTNTPVLELRGIKKHYPVRKRLFSSGASGTVKAVDGVSLSLRPGETLGLVGESGCGKSTIARLIMGLTPPTEGRILLGGEDVAGPGMMKLRRKVQLIFQDPYSSLDPRMNIGRIIEEPLRVHTRLSRKERRSKVSAVMETIGMSADALGKYPHEFSGGQRQRIGIARTLILGPELILCDEPVSALDVSVQAAILNLLRSMQRELGVSYLFISHDMSVVKFISRRIAVMYLGRIVEIADKQQLFANTLHPYSKALMSAIPVLDRGGKRERIILPGDPPSPVNPPPGCVFQGRCASVMGRCAKEVPGMIEIEPGHSVACHLFS